MKNTPDRFQAANVPATVVKTSPEPTRELVDVG
jgi:hypothetical protein